MEDSPGGSLERGHYLLRALRTSGRNTGALWFPFGTLVSACIATMLGLDSDYRAMLDKSYGLPRTGWIIVSPFDLGQGSLAASHVSLNGSQNAIQ